MIFRFCFQELTKTANKKAWDRMRKLKAMFEHPGGDKNEKANAKKFYDKMKMKHGTEPPLVSRVRPPPGGRRPPPGGGGRWYRRDPFDDIWSDMRRDRERRARDFSGARRAREERAARRAARKAQQEAANARREASRARSAAEWSQVNRKIRRGAGVAAVGLGLGGLAAYHIGKKNKEKEEKELRNLYKTNPEMFAI